MEVIHMFKHLFSLIFTLFCQIMALMVAPIWLNDSILALNLTPKAQLTTSQQVITKPTQAQTSECTIEAIKQAQINRLAAKKAQILQNYGATEQQINCQNRQNQQFLKQAYSQNLKTDQFLANAEHCLATHPGGYLPNIFDNNKIKLICNLVKNCGGDLNQIIIGNCKSLNYTAVAANANIKMFAYCSALTPGKHFIGINTDSHLVKNLSNNTDNIISHNGHKISCQLLFAQLIGHELCHIKYQDNLTVTLLSRLKAKNTNLRLDTTAYEAFCEERADTLSVLNCANPLIAAKYLQNNCAEGLYSHRKSPEWQQLINDLARIAR